MYRLMLMMADIYYNDLAFMYKLKLFKAAAPHPHHPTLHHPSSCTSSSSSRQPQHSSSLPDFPHTHPTRQACTTPAYYLVYKRKWSKATEADPRLQAPWARGFMDFMSLQAPPPPDMKSRREGR